MDEFLQHLLNAVMLGGTYALLGIESLDYWNQAINERAIQNEVKKMNPEQKKALAQQLMSDAAGKAAE